MATYPDTSGTCRRCGTFASLYLISEDYDILWCSDCMKEEGIKK